MNDYEKIKDISKVMEDEWETPEEISKKLGTNPPFTRAVLVWLANEVDEYGKKYHVPEESKHKEGGGAVKVLFKRDIRERGGLYDYI